MAGSVRVTTGRRSREKGDVVGVQVNVFGLRQLQDISGRELSVILMDAGSVALLEAQEEWPYLTGASLSTLELAVIETTDHAARVVLQAGGPALIAHPKNKSGKDYAPFIEFNGTLTARPGILMRAVYTNDREIRARIHDGVAALIRSKLA